MKAKTWEIATFSVILLLVLTVQGAYSATRVITGCVVDENGKPVRHGEVACVAPTSGLIWDSESAKLSSGLLFSMYIAPLTAFSSLRKGGRFNIDVQRDCIVYVRAEGFAPQSQLVPAGAPATSLKIIMSPAHCLVGILRDETGKPVGGADIHLAFAPPLNIYPENTGLGFDPYQYNNDAGYYLLPNTHSDKHGHFLLTNLPARHLYLKVTAAWHHSIEGLDIIPQHSPQRIAMRRLGKITGHILRQHDGSPVKQFYLWIDTPDQPIIDGMRNSPDGTFCEYEYDSDESPNPSWLIVAAPGCMTTRFEHLILFNADAKPLSIKLPAAGKLTGRVTELRSGKPLAGVVVSTMNEDDGIWASFMSGPFPAKTITDANGYFSLEADADSLPVVTWHKPGYGRVILHNVDAGKPLQVTMEKASTPLETK